MEQTQETQELITNYKQTNKLLRTRFVFLSIVFLIILGLFNNLSHNDVTRKELYGTINELINIAKSDSLEHSFNKAMNDMTFVIHHSGIDEYELAQLEYDLQKTNYQDKTPIFQLINKIKSQRDNLGQSSGDYEINILGMNTSFSNWLYFIPLILLLLYHDMLLIFLYRKSLQTRIQKAGISTWMLGPELFFQDQKVNDTLLNRGIQLLTTSFIAIFLILPLIPTAYGAIQYISENRQDDIQPLLVLIQWVSLIIMVIEAGVIYYNEDIFSSQQIFRSVFRLFTVNTLKIAIVEAAMIIILTTLFGLLSYDFPSEIKFYNSPPHIPEVNWIFILLVFFSLVPMLFGTILLLKNRFKQLGVVLRITGRLMTLSWVMLFISFLLADYTYISVYIPLDGWYASAYILFPVFIGIALLYVWIQKKTKRANVGIGLID